MQKLVSPAYRAYSAILCKVSNQLMALSPLQTLQTLARAHRIVWAIRLFLSYAVTDHSHLGDALSKDIPTVPLCYEKQGPQKQPSYLKSPIIFLHGLFGSKANTRTVAKRVARNMSRDVYCLDLRNFGLSPHAQKLDYPALSADVEKFIEEQRFEQKPILVGHSMGAKTVMALALRRPDLPKMIVSVDNAPVCLSASNEPFGKYVRQLRYGLEDKKYTNIKDLDAELAKVEPSREVRQFLLTNINRGAKDEACSSKIPLDIISKAISAGNFASWPYDSNVARWSQGPALFIRGTQSSYVPDEVIPDIGKYFPRFEMMDVDTGHWVISEKPNEFIQILQEFVDRKEDEELK